MQKCYITYLFLLYLTLPLGAQDTLESLAANLALKTSALPSEMIYLQTSKGIYETKEDLWFKAYQFDAQSLGLSDKSKTLYLQLINEKDSVVWQEKYPIENGIAPGHVYLNEKLSDGDYFLEAYTRHSFYDDTTEILSSRKVKIVKTIASGGIQTEKQESGLRFETLPEGGNLISGIPSRLAFKATDGKGNPIEVEGSLFQDDEPLTALKSSHNGMGSFFFTPISGKKYKITLKDGHSYPLPEIYPEGMGLRLIKQNKEQVEFMVSQRGGLPSQEIYLMAQVRGMVCCVAKGVLKDNLKIIIPLKEFLYQGIAEFTLFNNQMQPIAERLVYVHPEKKLHITLEPEKKSYDIREKATIKIKVTDDEGKPIQANLGISVFDKAYSNPTDPVNIFTHCYLSSQLRGKIYDPAYYFNPENPNRAEALDLLLLTQGWRRYVWSTTTPPCNGEMFLTDEITGVQTIESKKKQKEMQLTEQLIQVSGPEENTMLVWADSTGHFTITTDMMNELRGGYVYLKPLLTEEFKPRLDIKNFFPVIDTVRKTKQRYYPAIDLSRLKKEQVLAMSVVSRDSMILLNEVVVTGKARNLFHDKFMGKLDSLAQKDLGPWVCKHGWLENYKEGYTHHHDPRYCPNPTGDEEPRTAAVIGKTYTIMKAEYFPCNTPGGWCFKPIDRRQVVYQGAIYTEEELLRMNNLWRTKGYYATREFYQPDEMEIQVSIPDARNTLLWQPSVVTNEKGEATVSFYCSDINTGFTGYAEGVNGLGLLGNGECEFRVIRKVAE